MRLRDARHLELEALLKAHRIARENFSPMDSRLDGTTLASALRDEGIDVSGAPSDRLAERLFRGPLLTREEVRELIDGNLGTLFGQGWSELDEELTLGRRYAFHELDGVYARRSDGLELRPVVVELEAAEGLGRLLLSVEKVEEVVRDEREAEKRLSPVVTESEDESAYAESMEGALGSVVSIDPVLASPDPQPQLTRLCERLGVELLDVSAEGLRGRDLELKVNLYPH